MVLDIEKNVENFIINGVYGEILNYKTEGKTPIVEEYEKNQWSYVVEIMILTIKSLKPSESDGGNTIDYQRFYSELKLWTQYRHGMNKNLLNAVEGKLGEEYFTDIDETVYARLSVITAANQNWETLKREVIKTVLYSSAKPEILLEAVMLSKILFSILNNPKYDEEEIWTILKSEAINLSQTELSEYEEYFRRSKLDYKKDYKIGFERVRINLISFLNGISLKDDFKVLKSVMEVLKGSEGSESCEDLDEKSSFFVTGLKGLLAGETESDQIKDLKFLKSLTVYLVKLRKGRITSKSLGIALSDMSDIFKYDQGEIFTHPLLNSSKVIYRGTKGRYDVSYVQTRTGIYRFVNK